MCLCLLHNYLRRQQSTRMIIIVNNESVQNERRWRITADFGRTYVVVRSRRRKSTSFRWLLVHSRIERCKMPKGKGERKGERDIKTKTKICSMRAPFQHTNDSCTPRFRFYHPRKGYSRLLKRSVAKEERLSFSAVKNKNVELINDDETSKYRLCYRTNATGNVFLPPSWFQPYQRTIFHSAECSRFHRCRRLCSALLETVFYEVLFVEFIVFHCNAEKESSARRELSSCSRSDVVRWFSVP